MKKNFKMLVAVMLVLMLAFAMAGCGSDGGGGELITVKDGDVVGNGAVEMMVKIVDEDEINITVKTDEETVGAALLDAGLIAGEDSTYGLYIKAVNGKTYDYDKDKKYWAFYVGDAYAIKSADLTEIEEGVVYTFKVEK
ncbi:MAG: DUF4430 domain-containing protein [Firmicutes bacterium]|nr:DUF4430 domain-containing protein [Bacillota bacterium]